MRATAQLIYDANGRRFWTDLVGIDRWYQWNERHGTYAVIHMIDPEVLDFLSGNSHIPHACAVVDDFGNLVWIGRLQ